MNDPHVEALLYRVVHDDVVNYRKAPPSQFDEPEFRGTVDQGQVRFEMRSHCATIEAARAIVEPYIAAWVVSAGLRAGPNEFNLAYLDAEVVDREPTPGVVELSFTVASKSAMEATPTLDRGKYPEPPVGLRVNADVRSMYDRYEGYRLGQEPLDSMAYFCLTVVESRHATDRRAQAAQELAIDLQVLKRLGELVSEKGGDKPRKAGGLANRQSHTEKTWIDNAVKAIIRRAAEVAYDPGKKYETITISDLPELSQ